MSEDFRRRRRAIVVSEPDPPLKPENKRKRGGNEKQIIEVFVKKWPCAYRFDQPAIDSIEGTSRQTQRVNYIAERPHKRAVITRPAPMARSALRQNTIMDEDRKRDSHSQHHRRVYQR
jgi:hypothetical protein